jgi:hypothetical protein
LKELKNKIDILSQHIQKCQVNIGRNYTFLDIVLR